MKNYVIGVLGVSVLVLLSIIYKKEITPDNHFPILEETENDNIEVPIFLYLFFSKRNCKDCLEFIEVLNNLPPHFAVFGIVPEEELRDEKELRGKTGAAFPLMSSTKYKKFIPWYTPSVIGVSPEGDILFTLPGVPGEKRYLGDFLDSLYRKLYLVLANEKFANDTLRKGGQLR